MQIIVSLGSNVWDIQLGAVALLLAAWAAWELGQRVRGVRHGSG